jgi:hypothetical protein
VAQTGRRAGGDPGRAGARKWASNAADRRAHLCFRIFKDYPNRFKTPEFKNRKRYLPNLQKIMKNCRLIDLLKRNNFVHGQTSNSKQILKYKFNNFLRFEFALNFKVIQTSWDKSQELSKIMICESLHKYNFRSPYLYRSPINTRVSQSVPWFVPCTFGR